MIVNGYIRVEIAYTFSRKQGTGANNSPIMHERKWTVKRQAVVVRVISHNPPG